jgi:hypothetical protein
MKIENQVVSLELAKKLKELGVKQESIFCWCDEGDDLCLLEQGDAEILEKEYISAFTVAELGEILPPFYRSTNVGKDEIQWFEVTHTFDLKPAFYDETEADARAKMLIYLIENNLITLNK